MTRPSSETLAARFVSSELVKAEAALVAAQRATEDRAVADAIERVRKDLTPAVKRARLILEDIGLRTAKQTSLLDQPEEVDRGA